MKVKSRSKKKDKMLGLMGYGTWWSLLCLVLVTALLMVPVSPASAGGPYKWKISQGIAEDHPAAERCKQFAALVKEKSGGNIQLTYYPSGALGDWMEQIEGNRMGTLEIGLNAGSTSYDPRSNLMFMPYLFSSWDETRAAIGSEGWLTPVFNEIYSNIGLHVLGIFLNAWDGMAFTKRVKEVVKPPVERGIKMRVPPIRIFEVYIPTLGFISTPIAFSETFSALQTGIVDARSACPAVEAYVMRDALSYWINTKDAFEYWFLTINKDLWESLSKGDQELLTAAADKVMADQAIAAEKDERGFMDKLEASGVKVYEVSDEEWKAAARVVREKAWPVIQEELIGSLLMEKVEKHATPLD